MNNNTADKRNQNHHSNTPITTTPIRNVNTKTNTTEDSNRNVPIQSQGNITKSNDTTAYSRNNSNCNYQLKDLFDSTNNPLNINDKNSKPISFSTFKPKSNESEIILESQEKRSCCKLKNCAIF